VSDERGQEDEMKIRLFRVVWVLSVLWLGLMLYAGIFSDQENQLLFNLTIGGFPSAIGIIATYIATGTLFWPRDSRKD
jgi:hypothetical protein